MTSSIYAVTDPATGEVVREYPTATDEQVDRAVASAHAAATGWMSRSAPLSSRMSRSMSSGRQP